MAMNQSSNDEPRSAANEKKPYEKPGFRHEQVFVTSALNCTKTATEGQCMLSVQKLS
ncbi:MAG TPA: hypothetical protein VN310_07840 [Candidatus Dormibacteraeota bacterium]|jgi:hypothetical protein|nr:hypothetical protein [Candidatus Dormibacteraeota bacterium]